MNQLAEQPLVITQTGGSTGGGAIVTDAGVACITQYQNLQARFQQFLADETAGLLTYESQIPDNHIKVATGLTV